jgi:TPR repeat protein
LFGFNTTICISFVTGTGAVALNKVFLFTFLVLFLTSQPSFADMNAANKALARGDHAAAAAEFQKLAEQGDKKAQANLGYMYYVGEGVEQDYTKAVKWVKKAAILGDRDSQYNLAVAYAFGEGVKQSYKEAFHWYRRAAEQNHAVAQYSLGVSYAYGEGIAKNPELAAEWFKKSAEQGYERAQVLLGSLYHTGDGVEKNYEQAAHWYRKAADKGNAAAQYNLGSLYRAGNGVKQDYNQAVRWFRLSADQGYAAAQNELASMERAIAGANRPAPVSVPEIEDVPAQAETVPTESIKEPSQIPTMAKSEPEPKPVPESEVAAVEEPTEPETIELPAPDSTESTTEVEEKPKWGFFSKLFGKKDAVDLEPEQSGAVNETPGEGAAPENKYMPTLGSRAVVVEKNVTTEPESIEAPVPDTSEVATEAEEKPKRGFFSKLFGKKNPVDPEPEQDGVSVEIVTPEPAPVPVETKVVVVEEITEPETIDPPAPDTNEPEIIGIVSQIDEEPNEGFFTRLFVKKDTVPEDLTEQSIDESSEVITYAADSAPAGQQLEPSTEVEITVAQLDPVETPTQLPADSTLTEPELIVEDETEITIEEMPEEKTKKKGFFSRLFGGKKSADTGENSASEEIIPEEIISEEVVEIDSIEEPIIIAKLEEPELDAPIEEEPEEIIIESIDVTPDAIYTGTASDVHSLAVKGDSKAQFQLGTLYYQGKSVNQDYSQAFLWYRRAAQQGNSDAQYSLGNMYLMGEGIKQDDYQARQWYEKAAEQGHESAQHNLENLQRIAAAEPEYDPNENNPGNDLAEQDDAALEESEEKKGFFSKLFGKDDADEEELDEADSATEETNAFETGSEQMSADSSETTDNSASNVYEKGLAFEFGEGVPQSYRTAFEFFKKSADLDYAPAQYKLGLAYAYGQGAEKDPEVAVEWYQKSAAQGYTLAQRTLATLYMSGDGIEQNKPLALAWYDILADSGNVMDVHRRDALKEKLTSYEIDEANILKQGLSN